MTRVLFNVLLVLHGLVHLWFTVLAAGVVEFKEDMGWTGHSWLFTRLLGDQATRSAAAVLFALAAAGFVVGGIGLAAGQGWWRPVVVWSGVYSAVVIALFWDGGTDMIVQKGLVGLLLSVVAVVIAGLLRWPAPQA